MEGSVSDTRMRIADSGAVIRREGTAPAVLPRRCRHRKKIYCISPVAKQKRAHAGMQERFVSDNKYEHGGERKRHENANS